MVRLPIFSKYEETQRWPLMVIERQFERNRIGSHASCGVYLQNGVRAAGTLTLGIDCRVEFGEVERAPRHLAPAAPLW